MTVSVVKNYEYDDYDDRYEVIQHVYLVPNKNKNSRLVMVTVVIRKMSMMIIMITIMVVNTVNPRISSLGAYLFWMFFGWGFIRGVLI